MSFFDNVVVVVGKACKGTKVLTDAKKGVTNVVVERDFVVFTTGKKVVTIDIKKSMALGAFDTMKA